MKHDADRSDHQTSLEEETEVPAPTEKKNGSVDLELTKESATLAYSQVFEMMSHPEQYIGKTIRVTGLFAQQYDQNKNKRYYACLVQDAAGCCTQRIEFQPPDMDQYPEDFPADGSPITVTGTFGVYEEDGSSYAILKNAELE